MTTAVFDYAAWSARYPALAPKVTQDMANALFDEAGQYCQNDDAGLVPCDPVAFQPRLRMLGMIVAHLAILELRDTSGDGGPVGRVSQAAQGSVSASFEMGPAAGGKDWYAQTQPGASFWQASAPYRMGRFWPPCRRR